MAPIDFELPTEDDGRYTFDAARRQEKNVLQFWYRGHW